MDTLPSLPRLTPDDRYWRVDWFGECAYPGSVRRYAQPSIRVSLSPLRGDPSDHAALLAPDSTDHHHQHDAWPPVTALPLLAIGDIWHQGRHVASPNYQLESFKGLHITSDTSFFVKAGLALNAHFLLPLGQHPWHRTHTHSYCVAVALEDGRRLLVPCVELIRFYFGSSSNLLQRLFTSSLRSEMLWTSKRFNSQNRHLHLVLANRLSGAAASDIGRIAESRLAWRAAAGIYRSCQKATALRHPAYPYTGFPFEGRTDLEASGIWLPFGDREAATFLVYRLRSCSFPFPFHSLSYEAGDRKAWRAKGGDTETEASVAARTRSSAAVPADEGDSGSKKAQRRGAFRDRRQFPDLARKHVWREKIEATPKPDVFLRHADGSMEQIAFGEATGTGAAAGMDACDVSTRTSGANKDVSLPRFINVALNRIMAAPDFPLGARLALLRPDGGQGIVFSLPLVVDDDGAITDELLYCGPDGWSRPRRACFAEITVNASGQRSLLIVEGKSRAALATVIAAVKPSVEAAVALVLCEGRGQVHRPHAADTGNR